MWRRGSLQRSTLSRNGWQYIAQGGAVEAISLEMPLMAIVMGPNQPMIIYIIGGGTRPIKIKNG